MMSSKVKTTFLSRTLVAFESGVIERIFGGVLSTGPPGGGAALAHPRRARDTASVVRSRTMTSPSVRFDRASLSCRPGSPDHPPRHGQERARHISDCRAEPDEM